MNKRIVGKITALVLALVLLVATAIPAAAGGKVDTTCIKTKLANGYTEITCPDGGWD